jgi:hypothetical protein
VDDSVPARVRNVSSVSPADLQKHDFSAEITPRAAGTESAKQISSEKMGPVGVASRSGPTDQTRDKFTL